MIPHSPPSLDPPATTGEDRQATHHRPRVDYVVLGSALAICLGFAAWGVIDSPGLAGAADAALGNVIRSTGWLYILATAGFCVLVLWLAFSRYGRIRLGGDDERPEFSTKSWIAMLFAAGMGIGLVFWGVAEPLSHLGQPPPGAAQPHSAQAAELGMQHSIFHWGLHPWALYAVVGLALAYATFRKGRPNLLSSIVLPRKPVSSVRRRAIDIFAVFITTFGAATSLGLGAMQINSGLATTFGVPKNNAVAIAIIAGLTLLFVVSAVTGVHRGIKHISNINAALAGLLFAFVFLAGPSIYIVEKFTEALGNYVAQFVPMSLRTGAYGGEEWLSSWTIFYWAWWMSWVPFVGTFIARISRGRTIREFVTCVLFVPTLLSLAWFATMGGTALRLQLSGQADLTGALAETGEEGAIFAMLEQLPFPAISATLVVAVITLFFISSADSASVVLGMFCQRGAITPRRPLLVVWGFTIALTATVLLLAGGLSAIQTACIVVAVPFILLLIGACVSLVREVRQEPAAPQSPLDADQPNPERELTG